MLRSEIRLIPFRGNGPYCYSNTASMLLSTIGEQVSPQDVEAFTGVGLGAFWLPDEKLLFFSGISNPPDLGITRALRLLGFGFEEKVSDTAVEPPLEQLRSDLQTRRRFSVPRYGLSYAQSSSQENGRCRSLCSGLSFREGWCVDS